MDVPLCHGFIRAQWDYRWLKLGGAECGHLCKHAFLPFQRKFQVSCDCPSCHSYQGESSYQAGLERVAGRRGGRVAGQQGGRVVGWQVGGVLTGAFGGLS